MSTDPDGHDDRTFDAPPPAAAIDADPGSPNAAVVGEAPDPRDDWFPNAAATSAQIAAEALAAGADARLPALRSLVWRLLGDGRPGLAYNVARAVVAAHPGSAFVPPPWLMRAATLGPRICIDAGEIANVLAEDLAHPIEEALQPNCAEWNHAVRFLAAAAAMRPALLAPGTGASALLHVLHMKDGLGRVYELCDAIARFGDQPTPLDLSCLKKAKLQAEWEAELADLRRRADAWWAQAPLLKLIYAAAQDVWRQWLGARGVVHGLVTPVRGGEATASALETLRQQVRKLSGEDQVNALIDRTDAERRTYRGANRIIGPARAKLHTHMREAVELARDFVRLQGVRPGAAHNYLEQQTQALRGRLAGLYDAGLDDLARFEQRPWQSPVLVTAAAQVFREAVGDVRAIFDPNGPLPGPEPDPRHLLGADLLAAEGLAVGEGWEPAGPAAVDPAAALEPLLRLVALPRPPSRDEAFTARCRARDHVATGHLVRLREAEGAPPEELDRLREDRDRHIAECREGLARQVERARKSLDEAVGFGLLTEADFLRLGAAIDAVAAGGDAVLCFRDADRDLEAVEADLRGKRAAQVETVRRRAAIAGIGAAAPAHARIEAALARGDVLTANEYIDLTLSGQALPEAREDELGAFDRFFPGAARLVDGDLAAPARGPQAVIQAVRNGKAFGGIDFSRLDAAPRKELASTLEHWFTAKQRKRVEPKDVDAICGLLGLVVTGATTVTSSGSNQWADVITEQVQDVNRCPAAHYGSDARGRYRVLCVWNQPSERDLLDEVGRRQLGAPIVVFYFGRLTEQRRRDLARLSRDARARRTALVVDDVLLVHLCGDRGSRMSTAFQCGLPFTFLEPYNVTAGVDVPPEMFFGRERDVDRVLDPRGSCFIYGGRQLGKTALLREVERRFHDPAAGRVAVWLDLKDLCLGTDRPIADLWAVLATRLKAAAVVPASVPTHVGADKLAEHVVGWLAADPRRRVLLLLDEADRFLEVDAAGTADADGRRRSDVIADRLNGLMNTTDRRFKVVFAGLHNVQRTTRLANHPLTKTGEPICVGPLLDNGEWRQARALVEQPLGLLGYRFESPDLVFRILSQTNYYPSLIQLYCAYLLRQLTDTNNAGGFRREQTPPYRVTTRHVDDAYRNQDLQRAIRDRLIWTLQLDQRYEVIAYVIALGTLEDRERGTIGGFHVGWVRSEAIYWWSEGFRDDPSEEAFAGLLDEMVGLGILRRAGPGYFALRSPNVISLMGSQEEIERALQRSREPPQRYEAADLRPSFRAAGESGGGGPKLPDDAWRRSPLTNQQVADLRARNNGTTVVCGSAFAGLHEVEDFVESAAGREFFLPIARSMDLSAFRTRLDELNNREKSGTTIVFVPPTCPWDGRWVVEAAEKVERLKSKESFARVVFVADPDRTWALCQPAASPGGSAADPNASFVSLQPWRDPAVRQWLEDCGFAITDGAGRKKIAGITGGWHGAIRKFYDKCRDQTHRWETRLEELDRWFCDAVAAEALLADLGLGAAQRPEARAVLRPLAELGELPATDLAEYVDGTDPARVGTVLRWAELLSLATPAGGPVGAGGRDPRWQLDPFVARLLGAADQAGLATATPTAALAEGDR